MKPSLLAAKLIRFPMVESASPQMLRQLQVSALGLWHRKIEMMALESRKVIRWTSRNVHLIGLLWLFLMVSIGSLRFAFSPTPASDFSQVIELALPYLLIALAPIAGFFLARAAFPGRHSRTPNTLNLSPIGRWERIDHRQAKKHPYFGPVGFMATLTIGMLLNIAFRTVEFAIAIPALSSEAPEWGVVLFWVTTADTVAMSFMYSVCFVMALRSVPLFPKMLLYVWILDILMQLTIASTASSMAPPAEVAVALQDLLGSNIKKVLIAMTIWLPYLILSERVNVTYRHRIAS